MTLPPVIRIFFAIELAPAMKQQLTSLINILKKKSKTNAIRWTLPENLHITLQFLPQVRSEDLDRLIKNVRTHLAAIIQSSPLVLNGLEVFPNPFRPRVVVLRVLSQENLAQLSTLIGQGIQASEYEIEDRPFRAHLTLGRIKHPKSIDLNFLEACQPPRLEPINIDEVILFRSEPFPEGSKYVVLERIGLSRNN